MSTAKYAALALLVFGTAGAATLESRGQIPLPGGKGRIDHLAFDAEHRRLFIAELGNNSVAVVDVRNRRLERRLEGFDEPQGIAYLPAQNRLYVANGGDGTVQAYDTTTFGRVGRLKLPGDADNVRIDANASRLYVGYGDGGLAVFDARSLERIGDIPLKAHPESFQLAATRGRIFVNVPNAREIAVVDRAAARQVASWPAVTWSANYPMAIDESGQSVLVAFRKPARLVRYSMRDGSAVANSDVCGDADDVFVDQKRARIYVTCGEGAVDVLDVRTLQRIERKLTSPGARTGLYSTDTDELFVAVRADGSHDATILILQPVD